jgi:two-component system, NarL family, sensor kinase
MISEPRAGRPVPQDREKGPAVSGQQPPARHGVPRLGKASWAALGVALAILALGGAFVALCLAGPSDGAHIEFDQPAWRPDGVVVTPLGQQTDGLRPGDLVVAVEGRSLEAWAEGLFDAGASRPHWQVGQTIRYTVVRGGRAQELAVTLGRYPLGPSLAPYWGLVLFDLVLLAVGAFVFLRRPDDPAARACLVAAASALTGTTWFLGLQVGDLVGGTGLWLFQANGLAWSLFASAALHFALVFPRPHPLVVGRPWIVRTVYVVPYGLFSLYLAATWLGRTSVLEWLGGWSRGSIVPFALYVALIIAAMVSGYRRSPDAVTRQKIRWVFFGFLLAGLSALTLWDLPYAVLGHPLVSTSAVMLLALPYPLAIAIAILRYRLFDIDLIIRRTLVYGALTASLALLYWGSVVALQRVSYALVGQGSDLAIVGSTLTIAALFQPLRRRLQTIIDRRFYRRSYDASRVLVAFGAVARDEVDLGRLVDALVAAVDETMRPAHTSLWLSPAPGVHRRPTTAPSPPRR